MHRIYVIALALASLSVPMVAAADDPVADDEVASEAAAEMAAESAPRVPSFRFDVMLPSLTLYTAQRDRGRDDVGAMAEGELRFAHVSGHGALVRAGAGFGNIYYWPIFDVDYLYRFALVGDARRGIALDLSGGVSAGLGDDCDGFFGCSDHEAVDGWRVGANAGVTLSFHFDGFTIDLDLARYRVLVPTDTADAQEISEPEHVLSGGVAIGFGLW